MRVVVLGLLGLLVVVEGAEAAQLDAETCAKFKTEQTQLTERGARAALDAGPKVVASRLSQQQLEDVRRLIVVEQQVLFRCPQPPPPKPVAAEGAAAPGAAPKPKPKPAAAAKSVEDKPVAAGAVAAKPAVKAPVAAAAPGGDEVAKRAAKPAPKPKAEDAYKPSN